MKVQICEMERTIGLGGIADTTPMMGAAIDCVFTPVYCLTIDATAVLRRLLLEESAITAGAFANGCPNPIGALIR
jgi:hypothetical protein